MHRYTQCGHWKEGASVRLRFDVILHTATTHMLYIVFIIRKMLTLFLLENKTNRNEKN